MHGIDGKFLESVESVLSDTYQRFVLNGHTSSWADVKALDYDQVRIIRINLIQENNTASIFIYNILYLYIVKVNL